MKLIIESLGGACPVQGFGTLDGQRFYFRYRWDGAQLTVVPPDEAESNMPQERLYAEINDVVGNPLRQEKEDHGDRSRTGSRTATSRRGNTGS